MKVAAVLFCALLLAAPALALSGRVLDADSGKPIAGAVVTRSGEVAMTDGDGRYAFAASGGTVAARAVGYRRATVDAAGADEAPPLRLAPVRPKALYLSVWGIGERSLREAALAIAGATEINALVIDVKGDAGLVPYPSQVALAEAIGARRHTTVRDLPALVAKLKDDGLYLIARVVVFKDDPLAVAHPQWAVNTGAGALYRDREGLAWIDPARREAWDYTLDLAEEAAAAGFDEIQFDYVRFPDAVGLAFAVPNTEEERVTAIAGFLATARQRLAPYNVFIAADIFGYVAWNANDTFIGQKIEPLAAHADYLSPMLYPSGFHLGIPGYANPVAHPYEIVQLTLQRAIARSGLSPLRFRPWLQAFRDYAFDRRAFAGDEIRRQIDAAEAVGSHGWMLWNPRNVYTDAGLRKR
ncbi:putative glycoside hydrolase [Azospira restricta]|uniref:GTP-binding protein n=1 Tax=Azospira restricta TaxID=404405 RepID=A0A974SRC5_9RHOO|nr:putative glycoside hydrolase [Azospira restricta]QRJ65036.1 GTP-binding protein [Azospira restricta]